MRFLVALLLLVPTLVFAQVRGVVGPYNVSITTQPRVVPVGAAKVEIMVTDAKGKPMPDLAVKGIARMPGMFMGEREQRANQVLGKPGAYLMPTSFPMGGLYEVTINIDGQTGSVRLSTGQDTAGTGGSINLLTLLPWLVVVAIILFTFYRVLKSGQTINLKGFLTKGTLGGLLLLGLMLVAAVWAVNNLRRPGAMTPLEAQVMEMNTPAPPGTTAVKLVTVKRGSISESVRYSGQAVGFTVQDVNPRVTGTIVSMPVYVGDRVRKGQVIAQLDTAQLDPQLAERAAMTEAASQGVGVAAVEYQTALQEVSQARAELAVKQSMVDEANAMAEAAREDKRASESDLSAAQTEITSAEAERFSAEQAATTAAAQLERNRTLLADGFISRAALQQSESENADAQAKLRQSLSAINRAKAVVDSARANLRKAQAMIVASERKISQAKAEVRASEAAVKSRQSAAVGAKRAIGRERAGVAQAKAGYQGASAQKGFATLKAEVDGVVTERLVSPGTVVNPGQTILRVAQVSPIRLQANVPTTDLSRVKVGAWAVVTTPEGSGEIRGQVTSVAPGLDPASRTGTVEVQYQNADGKFLPGQFLSMRIELGRAAEALTVPQQSIQRPSGDGKPFVWVASPTPDKGVFTVRRVEVGLGISDADNVEVVTGLEEGQQVVTQGGRYLKEGGEVSADVDAPSAKGPVVEVSAAGFSPDTVQVKVGVPVTITFIRISEEGCGTDVVFPDLKIERKLPLNKPVEITFTPAAPGDLKFACGMDMLRGKVVVR